MKILSVAMRIWNLEVAFIKWVVHNRTYSIYGGTLFLTLVIFLSMWEPTFLLQVFNSILWLLTFGQVMPASWFGNGSNAPHFTLHLIIKLTVEGDNGWYGELNKGGYAIGIIFFSLISMIVIPFIRYGLSNHFKDKQSIIKAQEKFISEHPTKFGSEQELYKAVKDFIFINMDYLSTSTLKRRRREFIISSMVIELWDKPRQHSAVN